ncbi:hypothetical protein U1Q18_014482 [Sarracenia purpurea var. burkii]
MANQKGKFHLKGSSTNRYALLSPDFGEYVEGYPPLAGKIPKVWKPKKEPIVSVSVATKDLTEREDPLGDAASLPSRAPNVLTEDPSAAPRVGNKVKRASPLGAKDQRASSPGMPPSLSEKESVSSPIEKSGVAAEKSEAKGDVVVHSGSVEAPGLEEKDLFTESNLSSQGPGGAPVASFAEENDGISEMYVSELHPNLSKKGKDISTIPVSDEGREEFEEKQSCGVTETSVSGGVFGNIKTENSGGNFIAAQGVVLNKGIRDGVRANQGAHKGLGDKPLLSGDNPKVALLEEKSLDHQRSDKGP